MLHFLYKNNLLKINLQKQWLYKASSVKPVIANLTTPHLLGSW